MSSIMITDVFQVIITTIGKVFTSDDKKEKNILRFIGVLISISFIIAVAFAYFNDNKSVVRILSAVVVFITILILISFSILNAIQNEKEKIKNDQKLSKAEEVLEKNPNETNATWNIAKIKIEQYIDRNIKQVNSIYNICITVISIGFLIILAGIIAIYLEKDSNSSIIIIISGLITNFIGSTLLIIQKNVFKQSKEYLTALERINAVGMCLQIVDLIEEKEDTLKKDDAKSSIVKQVLSMYSEQ